MDIGWVCMNAKSSTNMFLPKKHIVVQRLILIKCNNKVQQLDMQYLNINGLFVMDIWTTHFYT